MAIFSGLGKFSNFGLLIMRAGVGVMMMTHGIPKLMGGPEKWAKIGEAIGNIGIHAYPVFWGFMAAASEGIGGFLLLLGLFFRPTSLFLLITMIVAVAHHFHSGDSIGEASHAIELAFVFFGFLFIGPGKYSVDKS